MRGKLKTELAALIVTLSLSACSGSVVVAPAFSDVQRWPPNLSEADSLRLVKNNPEFSRWVVETAQKCHKFGCVE